MIRKELTILHKDNYNSIGKLWMNPDLRKQCVVAVKQEDHYEFMECHFEVWHNGGNSITNDIICVNTLGIIFPISQLYYEYENEYSLENIEICLFDPNDEKDKKILEEISYELYLEYKQYNDF
jgi:hypothetical protein